MDTASTTPMIPLTPGLARLLAQAETRESQREEFLAGKWGKPLPEDIAFYEGRRFSLSDSPEESERLWGIVDELREALAGASS